MSIAASYQMGYAASNPAPVSSGYLERSRYTPLPFLLPVLIAGLSWSMGGSPWMTDMAFNLLTFICAAGLVLELYQFPRRFGIGALVLYGGTLVWFSYDYLNHWMGIDFGDPNVNFDAGVLAKATFCHALFVMMMAAGLLLPTPKVLTRLVHVVPEPASSNFYLILVVGLFIVGISPYFLFTVQGALDSMGADMTAGRTGTGAQWTVGRTGNVNYNWGAYAAILLQLGQIGGQLAVFYAVLVTRNWPAKLMCWAIWFFWLALAFGSGSRGQVVFMALPALALVYLKYQSFAAALFHRFSIRAYVLTGIVALFVLFLVQFQGYYRTIGFTAEEARIADVQLTKPMGTSMFSEGLLGYALIPHDADFFYNRVPGEKLISPLPRTLYWFAVGPVPRALWTTKPIDPVWDWYNEVFTGGRSRFSGTTISQGLVGYWYFRYGLAGVIQNDLLLGWLMILAERALQGCEGKPIRILFTLAYATWLFRIFRGVNFNSLYPILIGGVVLYFLIHAYNSMIGGRPNVNPASTPPTPGPGGRRGFS